MCYGNKKRAFLHLYRYDIEEPRREVHYLYLRVVQQFQPHPFALNHYLIADRQLLQRSVVKVYKYMLYTAVFTRNKPFTTLRIPGRDPCAVAYTRKQVKGRICLLIGIL